MDPAATRYIERRGATLAYQVVGQAGADVVRRLEINQHLDLASTDPHLHRLMERAEQWSRSVYMQRAGFGLSDPIDTVPTAEQQADDVLAVMDAVGMRRATLAGALSACPALVLAAARYPDRVHALVLIQPLVQGPRTAQVPHGWTAEQADEVARGWEEAVGNWGSGGTLSMWDRTLATSYNRRLIMMQERCSASPAAARAHLDWALHLDITEVLPTVQVPTWVVRVPGSPMPEAAVAYVAESIPNARYRVLAENAPGTSLGESWTEVEDITEEAATGAVHPIDRDRSLGAVLFTDLVGSTEMLAQIGDGRYRQLRADYERIVRLEVERAGGRLANVTGDGTLSIFDGPTPAVRCAQAIHAAVCKIGLAMRAGIHTGEVEHTGSDITGMTVHVGARVAAKAVAGQVLVSQTVHDMMVGSEWVFHDVGSHPLKGISGRWRLYAVDAVAVAAVADGPQPLEVRPADRVALGLARRAPGTARTLAAIGQHWQRRRFGRTSGPV